MHFKEKDALYGERCTLRRKTHFKEKDALYGERCTLRRKRKTTVLEVSVKANAFR